MNIIYDCETFPNVFTLAAEHADLPITWQFEISDWCDDSREIIEFCRWIRESNGSMIGFNNVGFDYPVLHTLIKMGKGSAKVLYDKAIAIITSQDQNRWAHMVYPSDRFVEQIDLYLINHFDNHARATSLKALEFTMRMANVSDLPFPVGTTLVKEQVQILHDYNVHDVRATKLFYHKCKEAIAFRESLTLKHGRDFMNANDTKIGAQIFEMELEKRGVHLYEYGQEGRKPRQTKREYIRLADCIPSWIHLTNPEFVRVKDWLNQQVIAETKGIFKGLIAHTYGLDFVFGTGGLHASVENRTFRSDDTMMIIDVDVASLYPSIAIVNRYYPEHLTEQFADVYSDLKDERFKHKKGTLENAALKLALNGTYGKSNDKFSIFYDPRFTMQITIGGQLMICMLVERLAQFGEIAQVNTDGITCHIPRYAETAFRAACKEWEALTKLELEYVEYSLMTIRDVNNYLAVKLNGDVKRKGAYEHVALWHQDASALVVAKVAEQVLVYGKPLRETVENWPDKWDFYQRIKIPRNSHLLLTDEHGEHQQQNTTRYYVAKGGGILTKVMPPLKGKTEWRRFAVEKGWKVCVCNDIKDAVLPIDYEYYIQETEKLCLSVM